MTEIAEADLQAAAERLAYGVWNYGRPNETAVGQARHLIDTVLNAFRTDATDGFVSPLADIARALDGRSDQVPTAETAFRLMARAVNPDEVQVLGWADNAVMRRGAGAGTGRDPGGTLNFTVAGRPRRSHEDSVIIVALVPPHPEHVTLEQLVDGDLNVSDATPGR